MESMRTNFKLHLILFVLACIFAIGCNIFSKSEKQKGPGELISIIVQVRKNTDIESLVMRHKDLNLVAVKLLSARMGTWEMTINYRRTEVNIAMNLLKQNESIANVQLNHKIDMRND